MSLEVAWATNRDPGRSIVVRGTEGGAALEGNAEGDLALNTAGREGGDHYVDTTLDGTLEHTGHAGAQSVFLDALRADERPDTCSFEEAIRTQRIMDAIYESSERNAAVRLD